MKRTTTWATLALASALALAGCGGTSKDTAAPEATTSSATTTTPASPSGSTAAVPAEHNDDDVTFARAMLPHHQQAVDMSRTLLTKKEVPAAIGNFAQRVIDAQGPEIDQLNTMLDAWGEEATVEGSDAEDTDHSSEHGSDMAGMMSQEDMAALEDAQGNQAARLYLEQMTEHHRGAIDMARDETRTGQNPQAVEMAKKIVHDQQAEIQEMEQLLQGLPSDS